MSDLPPERPDQPQAQRSLDARRSERSTRWIEWLSALLLALGAVGAAWSGYEAARWSGVQATEFSNANGARQDSVRAAATGGQLVQIDITSFFQVVNAFAAGQTELQDFYAERLRPEFEPVFQEWLALDPASNPDAPLSPFDLPSYSVDELADAERRSLEAEMATERARDANQNGNDYTVSLVLFSAALFFGGISTKFSSTRSRLIMLGIGTVLFIGVSIWVGSLPKSVSL
ncbi:MAG: hypothetical protein ACE5EV_03120 [Gaiellales bacterium]